MSESVAEVLKIPASEYESEVKFLPGSECVPESTSELMSEPMFMSEPEVVSEVVCT